MGYESRAKRLFMKTMIRCSWEIRHFGFRVNGNGEAVGFTGLSFDRLNDPDPSSKTLDEVEAMIRSYRKNAQISGDLGVMDADSVTHRLQVADMMKATLANQRRCPPLW